MTSERSTSAPAAFSDVFISYRRQEASYLAAWLHDALIHRLGSENVFLDIDCIKPGADFIHSIELALRHSAVVLVIIGSEWLIDDQGIRRIDASDDPVRLEIEIALSEEITVLPILLDDAKMPRANDLPPSIAELTRINSLRIRRDSARSDLSMLLQVVEAQIPHLNPALSAHGPLPEIEPQAVDPQPHMSTINPGLLRRQRERLVLQLENLYAERFNAMDQIGVSLQSTFDFAPEKIFRVGDQFLTTTRSPLRSAPALGVAALLDAVGGRLSDGILLLGSAGSGKTSSIFEIGQYLIRETRNHDDRPLPVYLHLSTWASKRGPMRDWVVEQLQQLYQVPVPLGRHWVASGALFLLLDGLDEVSDPIARSACAKEINRYNRFGRQISAPTIVACRTEEYDVLGFALNLGEAAIVRPLDPDIVLQQLTLSGPSARALAARHIEHPDLQKLLVSPLLVTMLLSLTSNEDQTATATTYEQSSDLIGGYLHHRLELERRRTIARRNAYPRDLTHRWLSNLARNLDQSQQTIFLPDRIPPDWLSSRGSRRLVLLIVPTVWGAVLGLTFALALTLAAKLDLGSPFNPFATIISFTSLGFVAAAVHAKKLYFRCVLWFTIGMAFVTLWDVADQTASISSTLTGGFIYGLFFGLIGELAVALLGGQLDPVEHLSFSWAVVRKTVPRLCLAGVVVGIAFSIVNWSSSGLALSYALLLGFVFGLMLGAVFGLTLALRKGIQMTLIPDRMRPLEGLRRSVRYGLLIGLGSGATVGAAFFVSGLLVSPELGLIRGITWGPAAGCLYALATGHGAVIQYWMRRLLLWRAGVAPLRYMRWLEYAVDLRVLYRTGGGYVFMHRILQDKLAHESYD